MKKDKKWLIDEINNLYGDADYIQFDWNNAVSACFDLADQLDEPQKPVLPKWFDEWVKKNIISESRTYSRLCELFSDELAMELTLEQNDWIESHIDEAIRAILDGYEVEKEKMYWVRNKYGLALLQRVGKCLMASSHAIEWEQEEFTTRYQFTEQEIKDYDERYVPFMVPVEEVDNE